MRQYEDPAAMERIAARKTLGLVLRYFDEVECVEVRLTLLPLARWRCVLALGLPGGPLHIEAEGDTAWDAFAGAAEPLETMLFAAIHRDHPDSGAQEREACLRSAA